MQWLQTIIKITVLYLLITVLYLLYSTLDVLWHKYSINFLFDPPTHKPTNKFKVFQLF